MATKEEVDTTGAAEKALAAQGATVDTTSKSTDTTGAAAPAAETNVAPAAVVDPAKVAADKAAADATAAEVAAAAALTAKTAADKAALEAGGPLKAFSVYENPAAQAAVNLLKTAGLGPNEAAAFFAEAVKSNDLSKVDVAGLEAKIGKDQATLVMAGAKAHYDDLKAQSDATVKQTHTIFNGEANWNTVKTWAQNAEKTDAKIKAKVDDVRSMLNQGGTQAEAAARELLRMFNADPTTKGLGTAKLVTGETTGNVIGTALTRSAYLTELKAADARGASHTEIAAINARRVAGRAQGI